MENDSPKGERLKITQSEESLSPLSFFVQALEEIEEKGGNAS